jgi:hypothetical protein
MHREPGQGKEHPGLTERKILNNLLYKTVQTFYIISINKPTQRGKNMIKFIGAIILIGLLAVGGYTVYRGLTGDNDNADKVANKASELVSSVADTFADGAKDMAKDAKSLGSEAVDSVKSTAVKAVDSVKDGTSKAVDSAKSGVASRISDIREANKKKFTK